MIDENIYDVVNLALNDESIEAGLLVSALDGPALQVSPVDVVFVEGETIELSRFGFQDRFGLR